MKKIISTISGYILLLTGLIIIGFALYSSFNVFTGEKVAPQLFQEKVMNEDQQSSSQLDRLLQQKLGQMLPTQHFAQLMNLISYSILTGLFIFGGSKISTIGIRLIKT